MNSVDSSRISLFQTCRYLLLQNLGTLIQNLLRQLKRHIDLFDCCIAIFFLCYEMKIFCMCHYFNCSDYTRFSYDFPVFIFTFLTTFGYPSIIAFVVIFLASVQVSSSV